MVKERREKVKIGVFSSSSTRRVINHILRPSVVKDISMFLYPNIETHTHAHLKMTKIFFWIIKHLCKELCFFWKWEKFITYKIIVSHNSVPGCVYCTIGKGTHFLCKDLFISAIRKEFFLCQLCDSVVTHILWILLDLVLLSRGLQSGSFIS